MTDRTNAQVNEERAELLAHVRADHGPRAWPEDSFFFTLEEMHEAHDQLHANGSDHV